MVVDIAPIVEDCACLKRESMDDFLEEHAEEARSLKPQEEMKVEFIEEAMPREEAKEVVGMQCESWDNITSGDITTNGDNRTSGDNINNRGVDTKPNTSSDVASSSNRTILVRTQGTQHL